MSDNVYVLHTPSGHLWWWVMGTCPSTRLLCGFNQSEMFDQAVPWPADEALQADEVFVSKEDAYMALLEYHARVALGPNGS